MHKTELMMIWKIGLISPHIT